MIAFSIEEIAFSILAALCYGLIFSAGLSFVLALIGVAFCAPAAGKIYMYEKIFPLPTFKELNINRKFGMTTWILSIALYWLGFCLLSYLALDGELRLYMLVLSFASFYLSNFAFSAFFTKLFLYFSRVFLIVLSLVFRMIFAPIKAFCSALKKRYAKKY